MDWERVEMENLRPLPRPSGSERIRACALLDPQVILLLFEKHCLSQSLGSLSKAASLAFFMR